MIGLFRDRRRSKRDAEPGRESGAMTTAKKTTLQDPSDRVRGAISRMDDQLAIGECSPELRAAWASVVEALALGPAPELRECPSCGRIGMRDATRCGHCWVKLTAPTAE
jgi:hypothetical protein